jgi:hypothetical protein
MLNDTGRRSFEGHISVVPEQQDPRIWYGYRQKSLSHSFSFAIQVVSAWLLLFVGFKPWTATILGNGVSAFVLRSIYISTSERTNSTLGSADGRSLAGSSGRKESPRLESRPGKSEWTWIVDEWVLLSLIGPELFLVDCLHGLLCRWMRLPDYTRWERPAGDLTGLKPFSTEGEGGWSERTWYSVALVMWWLRLGLTRWDCLGLPY